MKYKPFGKDRPPGQTKRICQKKLNRDTPEAQKDQTYLVLYSEKIIVEREHNAYRRKVLRKHSRRLLHHRICFIGSGKVHYTL
jgi:hypothetical protein